MKEYIKRFYEFIKINKLSVTGAILTTFSFPAGVMFIVFESFLGSLYPTLEFLLYLIIPGTFIIGLVLIPIGELRARARALRDGDTARLSFFSMDSLRQLFPIFSVLTFINILFLVIVGLKSYSFMDSSRFCGLVCHKVMQPEYTRYLLSPHARVECAECHIGAGASWFVKSKISGARQFYSVLFNKYHKPIPTPVDNLRPSRDTCEKCHWPEKFYADKLIIRPRFLMNENNEKTYNVLIMKIGGSQENQNPHGIHWHVSENVQVFYTSTNDDREDILYVEVHYKNSNQIKSFYKKGVDPAIAKSAPRRLMDCIDCHNRPTHIFQEPGDILDQKLATNQIDPSLPWIKMVTFQAITLPFPDSLPMAERLDSLRSFITEFYQNYPSDQNFKSRLESSINTVLQIYRENIFPEMKITWGTYPNHLKHKEKKGGCLRCHDNLHINPENNESIQLDCNLCHLIVAKQAYNPEIIKLLKEIALNPFQDKRSQ